MDKSGIFHAKPNIYVLIHIRIKGDVGTEKLV